MTKHYWTRDDETLGNQDVRDVLHQARYKADRRRYHEGTWHILSREILAHERARISACMTKLGAFESTERDGTLDYIGLRCRELLCPRCQPFEHYRRFADQARTIQMLDPEPEIASRKPRVLSIVAHMPQVLHEHAATHPEVIDAMSRAFHEFVARSYDYKHTGRGSKTWKAHELFSRDMGMIVNVHAIGDRATPWPKPAPHLDALLCGYKVVRDAKGTPTGLMHVNEKWPKLYDHSRELWGNLLRRHLMPVLPIELKAAISNDDVVMIDFGRRMLEGPEAISKIKYSTRSLIDTGLYRIREDGILVNAWTDRHGHHCHEVPVREFVKRVVRIQRIMEGKHSIRKVGICKGKSWNHIMKSLDRQAEARPAKRKLAHGYRPGPKGYERVDPCNLIRS